MTAEKVDLRGAAATLLLTLYMRAWDARQRNPILGDRYAVEVMERIDVDRRLLFLASGDASAVTCRARTLDGWTREFLAAHPDDAQVLHLGCGLDSRPLRVEVPESCRWLDVDQPEVIDLRRRLYALPDHVETIPSSVSDDGWWSHVATDRPTLAIAEGLFMYVPGGDVHRAVDRLTDTASEGELAFDAVAPWTVFASGMAPSFRTAGARFRWSWDGTDFAKRHPRLWEVDDVSVYDMAAISEPRVYLRPLLSLAGLVPAMRDSMRLHRFRFSGITS
ncbi:class I SAM-dependent methyltransferase [Pseudonocardia endophytica]|uniref:O-methyltransferase involved in polyketide biosynthesis n=1 Tax=Pseudonocardia endophytica TaxID=401976 RepID=A0A4R1I8U3_PSEEN|nr:class I SAM-dependent methyltransferase [Pseudonocardia endophytica]TCK26612.1 O-methyltransferase involved in polyketide biosynthesis [Pseudonocardia endophytica]